MTVQKSRTSPSAARPNLRAQLQTAFHAANPFVVPMVEKVVVAAGTGKHRTEGKFVEDVERGLALLTGQKASPRKARKSIAGFKVRQGQVVGFVVTLRGRRMADFLTRLVRVALPRVRDFRGVPLASVDPRGVLSMGFKEASAFPEVDPAIVETVFGLQVTIVPTVQDRETALALYRALGIPFADR